MQKDQQKGAKSSLTVPALGCSQKMSRNLKLLVVDVGSENQNDKQLHEGREKGRQMSIACCSFACHCERSEAIQSYVNACRRSGLPRRCTPSKDGRLLMSSPSPIASEANLRQSIGPSVISLNVGNKIATPFEPA